MLHHIAWQRLEAELLNQRDVARKSRPHIIRQGLDFRRDGRIENFDRPAHFCYISKKRYMDKSIIAVVSGAYDRSSYGPGLDSLLRRRFGMAVWRGRLARRTFRVSLSAL